MDGSGDKQGYIKAGGMRLSLEFAATTTNTPIERLLRNKKKTLKTNSIVEARQRKARSQSIPNEGDKSGTGQV